MIDLDDTRRHLREITDLHAQVGSYLTPGSVPPDPDARRGSGSKSRPPIVVDVVDLVAGRKSGWLGWQPGDDVEYLDQSGWRHGIRGTLELWVMLLEAEMADQGRSFTPCELDTLATVTGWLTFHLEWIVEHHGRDNGNFVGDIGRMHRALQRACGVRPEQTYVCPKCRARAFLDHTTRFLVCETGEHEVGIENLEMNQRRRSAMPTKDIIKEFPVTAKELHNASRGLRPKIRPTHGPDGDIRWYPWDVLRLLNPDLAEAIEHRDSVGA